ncbi:hypothetical protein OTK49_01950 [Vibrio coralliirubri]|nr:hypothetical protein [Vibrio coralliirubri]MCY9861277.1 hypothetical protein [Vibrio coralliirubri]
MSCWVMVAVNTENPLNSLMEFHVSIAAFELIGLCTPIVEFVPVVEFMN